MSFLTLPRELRDIIYRHLLSTKHTWAFFREPEVDSLRGSYKYQFHPSILRTSRQIEREASHILYIENLLVRVTSRGQRLSVLDFYPSERNPGNTVRILACEDRAKQCKSHVMEVVMLQDYEIGFDPIYGTPFAEDCFIIVGEELPKFCWALLWKTDFWVDMLLRLTLVVEIRHNMIVSTVSGEATLENQNGPMNKEYKEFDADFKYKATAGELTLESRIQIGNERSRRLLEPLRCLHSMQAVHIEGPVSEQYKASLSASMCRPGPTDQELLAAASAMFEDARATYDADDFPLATTKMKRTLDTIDDYREMASSRSHHLSAIWDACEPMRLRLWTNLGLASLENRQISKNIYDAINCLRRILKYNNYSEWWTAPPVGHEVAMVFYLWAQASEALADLKNIDPRWYIIPRSVYYLREGVRHEPGNKVLAQELRRREEALRLVEEVHDMMKMSDRINGQEYYAPEL